MTEGRQQEDTRTWRARLVVVGPPLLLALFAITGLVLNAAGLLDWRGLLDRAQAYEAGWALALGLIGLQAILFLFGLPGSSLVWAVAILYPLPAATLILTAGGSAGAMLAWKFAHRLTRGFAHEIADSCIYRRLASGGDLLTLCALRIMPGVPHSLINYTAGTVGIPPGRFLLASIPGLALKAFLYSMAIGEMVGAASLADAISWATLGPLVLIALLLLAGRGLRQRWLDAPDRQDRAD